VWLVGVCQLRRSAAPGSSPEDDPTEHVDVVGTVDVEELFVRGSQVPGAHDDGGRNSVELAVQLGAASAFICPGLRP
jgi:hypothetical protein